jgi:aspartate/methionine/tyrosine aminotransferase
MTTINEQAKELNAAIQKDNPSVFEMLSEKGKTIFFPSLGIVQQSADAKGKKIDATIGIAVEDDGSPMRLDAIANLIKLDPKNSFPYSSSYGKPELRKKWQEMIRAKNPSLKGKFSLPVVTCALTHGLSIATYLFVNPGDKILVPDKYWENYNLIFENGFGGELAFFNMFKNGGLDVESFEKGLAGLGKKKIVLLTFPNNPTGYTPTREEADKIGSLLLKEAEKGNSVLVLVDDAYFGLVYEPGIAEDSIFAKLADLHENLLAVKIDGATKEVYVWGFRVGFITFASRGITDATCTALEAKAAGSVRGSISNAPHLSQNLVYAGINSPNYEAEKKAKFEILKKRYLKVKAVFKVDGDKYREVFVPLPFNSGYFMCVELNEKLNAEKVRQTLLKKYDTGVISVGNLLRVAYSSIPGKTIPELFDNIFNACQEM